MPSCLRHAAHPFKLFAIQIVSSLNFAALIVNALLPLVQIIGVITTVGVDISVVKLNDHIAYVVKKISVVGHHEKRERRAREIILKPNNHVEVEMIGGFVKNEKVGLGDQDVGERHSFCCPPLS